MRDAGLPVTLIVVGLMWLVWYFGWFPDVDWIIAFARCRRIAVLAFDGIRSRRRHRPFMIASGIAWLLHDRYRFSWAVLIPSMLICLGVLMLVARSPKIPVRRKAAREPE
jgi:hypothetical protein